ncbi:FAD-dependent oxidoreductase [Micromonospora zingiberis]|uniref:FAD-dependent oxidoreductase n=1 Tax=Micromonospora zingiberis TaxID=2053011 RepID=A0A4R0GHM9_9ACTN|nr:FAD-dependent oxidoreductase [Micromonospora zingiberis]TCB96870.1 FAD-dependent oxidoreductase [Micromonospora zingiberis]
MDAPHPGPEANAPGDPDVVIYGATLAGIMAALRLRLRGLTSLILEPTGHVGGIVAGGLVKTDAPNVDEAHAGLTRSRYFAGIGAEYGTDDAQYLFEPKVAQRVAQRLITEANATVQLHQRIHGPQDVEVTGRRITGVRTADGWRRARFFIDASYEGDLMAAAGVPYVVGREPASRYDEPYAGFQPVQAYRRGPFRPNTLYPVGPAPRSAAGEGDDKTQAYNFRGVLTRDADRLPFPKPEDYDPKRYLYLRQLLEHRGIPGLSSIVTHTALLPNGKYQTNQALFIGFDLPGASWDYPDGSWRRREEIIAEQARWHQGMLYFLANDPSLPETFRADARTFGLPTDEFLDSPHGPGFPHALYIREARRLLGATVLTQHHLLKPNNTTATPVCCWKYGMDSHVVQYYAEGGDTIVGEGTLSGTEHNPPVDLYQIPAECLFPAAGGIENLTVGICFSASHVGYSSPRMEPNYGMLGEACGELAAQTIRTGRPVQEYRYAELAAALTEHGSVLDLPGLR